MAQRVSDTSATFVTIPVTVHTHRFKQYIGLSAYLPYATIGACIPADTSANVLGMGHHKFRNCTEPFVIWYGN